MKSSSKNKAQGRDMPTQSRTTCSSLCQEPHDRIKLVPYVWSPIDVDEQLFSSKTLMPSYMRSLRTSVCSSNPCTLPPKLNWPREDPIYHTSLSTVSINSTVSASSSYLMRSSRDRKAEIKMKCSPSCDCVHAMPTLAMQIIKAEPVKNPGYQIRIFPMQ